MHFSYFLTPVIFGSCCFFIAESSFTDESKDQRGNDAEERLSPLGSEVVSRINSRQDRSFLKKLGFLSGLKIGSSSHSSGQLIASHNGNLLGKFLNANIRLIYGSQPPVLTGGLGGFGGLGGVGAVIPPVTPVAATGPLKGGPDTSDKLAPGFVLVPLRRDPSGSDKNQTEDQLSVESILIPVYERVGSVKVADPAGATTTITTASPQKENATIEGLPPANNETATDRFFII